MEFKYLEHLSTTNDEIINKSFNYFNKSSGKQSKHVLCTEQNQKSKDLNSFIDNKTQSKSIFAYESCSGSNFSAKSSKNLNFRNKDLPFLFDLEYKKDSVNSWVLSNSNILSKLDNPSKVSSKMSKFNDSTLYN
jgi:hypothetical protein